jgi:CPA2 family monovalent cation:H+ antiporter-2
MNDQLALIVLLLGTAVAAVTLFRRLRLPAVVAYLLAGLAAGPAGFGWVQDTQDILHLAEFGVVFLLFSLGLEFSIPRLLALRQVVFGAGPIQVLVTGGLVAGTMHLLGFSPQTSLITGGALALSSTAIVIRELISRGDVNTRYGRSATGILLFQDLAAVIMLVLLPALTMPGGDPWQEAGATLLKSVMLFAGIFIAGKWVLPKLLEETVRTRSDEVFVMTALLLALLAAWVTHALGLSMALGAFLAGMMLGESQFRHQIEADIRPFRDLLLGLFFVSVGMLVDPALMLDHWHWILLASLALMLFKGAFITGMMYLLGERAETAMRSGIVLAQGGEFGFVLVTLAVQHDAMSADRAGLVVSIAVLTMAATPALIQYSSPMAQWLLKRFDSGEDNNEDVRIPEEGAGHVILCGYGRVGQILGRYLGRFHIPWVALDADLVRIHEATLAGERILFGDATRKDILEKVGIHHASLLVVTFDNAATASRILHTAHALRPDLRVLVRTRDDSQLEMLQNAGATEVVPETLEASLMLISHALLLLDTPFEKVLAMLRQSRRERYQLLHGYYHGESFPTTDAEGRPYRLLHAVTLEGKSRCAGRRLEETGLDKLDVEVQEIKRAGEVFSLPSSDFQLEKGDILILYGPLGAVDKAEQKLLGG